MTNWIKPSEALPPLRMSVLVVVKATCSCNHYLQDVLTRMEEDGEWYWSTGDLNPETQQIGGYKQDKVLYWRYLPKLPHGCEAGYKELDA